MKKEISEILNLVENKNIDKAFVEAKKIFQIDPDNLNIIKVLAFLHLQKNQFDSTINLLNGYYDKFSDKKDFDYYVNMGFSYKGIEEYSISLEMYQKAKDINPNSPICYTSLAEIYLKLGEYQKADELIDIAFKIVMSSKIKSPHFPNTIKIKTDINVALGRDNENGPFLIKLLDDDFNPDVFYLLATTNTKLIDEKLLKKAEAYLRGNEKGFKNSLERFWYVQPLYFGLAIYYHKKNNSRSEEMYHKGNEETMKSLRYNSFEYQKNITTIIDSYTNKFINLKEVNYLGQKNIFILGTPRSGTTLIESIIGSHKDVTSGGELLSASKLIQEFIDNNDNQQIEDFREYFCRVYLSRTDYIRQDSKYIIDKLPENFLFIGQLNKLLPSAKIIRTFRNPWDVAISLYKQRYVANIPFSASFFNIGVFMANYEAINYFWDQNIKNKQNILDIYYEDLVKDPQRYQKKIYQFLELEEGEYNENNRKKFFSQTASIRQIGSEINVRSIEKKEFMDKKEDFYDALNMQRKFWQKKGFCPDNTKFFGYDLN